MNNMEQNRQIVQAGLDNRANKRKKAMMEAEQEVITIQMFKIVNANSATAKPHPVCCESTICKAKKRSHKKTVVLRNISAINMIASILAIGVSVGFNFGAIPQMIATSVLPVFMFIFNLCMLINAHKKLKRRI